MGKGWALIAACVAAGCTSAPLPAAHSRKPSPHAALPTHDEYLASPRAKPKADGSTSSSNDGVASMKCAKGSGCYLHIDLRDDWAPAVTSTVYKYERFENVFVAQGLLLVVKKQDAVLAAAADEVVVAEEGKVVALAHLIRTRLVSNDPTPIAERKFLAHIEFDDAIDALRARVAKGVCAVAVEQLVATPPVVAALRSALVEYGKLYGYPSATYEPEIAHGKRFLMSHCDEFPPDLDAAIQRRRGTWFAIMNPKIEP